MNPYETSIGVQAVRVTLQPQVETAPQGTPQPGNIDIYMTQADGDEMELGESFFVEVKPDKP